MIQSPPTSTILTLHALMHMNARARARHRVAAASLGGEQRYAHEAAALRHEAFARALRARLSEISGGPQAATILWVASDVGTGGEARIVLRSGRARLLARYEEAGAEPLDADTHAMLREQYETLLGETAWAIIEPPAAAVA